MNIEQQRKAFLYELNGHGYHFKNTDWYDDWERFEDEQLNMVWEMWLAGQKQEGYVMVPVEPIEEIDLMICKMVDHRIDCFEADRIYKAIIEESQK